MTKILSVLKVVKLHQHAIYRPFLPCVVKKCPNTTHLTSLNKSLWCQIWKIISMTKSNQFSGWSGYIRKLNVMSFLPFFVKQMPGCLIFDTFAKSKCNRNEESHQTVTKILSVLNVVGIHLHATFPYSHTFSGKCAETSREAGRGRFLQSVIWLMGGGSICRTDGRAEGLTKNPNT